MIKQIATAICLFACIAPALADDEKDKETHAETPSPVLQSLPAEVQKNIEEVRTACREYWNDIGADPSQPISPLAVAPRVSSGDDGLILFTVSGAQAVMVSNLDALWWSVSQGRHLLHRGQLRHQHLRPHRPRLEECPLDHGVRGRFSEHR